MSFPVQVWQEPVPQGVYAIGVDVGHGLDKGDDSVAVVLCCNNGEQVAQVCDKIPPLDLADLCYDLGHYYNEALVGIENNVDASCCQALFDNGYGEIYYELEETGRPYQKPTEKLGFNMNRRTRPMVITQLREWIKDGSVVFRSPLLFDQLEIFALHQGKFQALPGGHDDVVMASAIAVEMMRVQLLQRRIEERIPGQWMGLEVKEEDVLREENDEWSPRLDPKHLVDRNIEQVRSGQGPATTMGELL